MDRWVKIVVAHRPIVLVLVVMIVIVIVVPYSRSEVIHRDGDEGFFPAFERERPRIVNNFAASASSGYELSSSRTRSRPRCPFPLRGRKTFNPLYPRFYGSR